MGQITEGVLQIGGLIAGFAGRKQTEEAQEQAAAFRLQQETLAEQERSTQRTRRLNEILAQQNAAVGAKGFTAASPSFFAIQTDTLNQFAQDENADLLSLDFDKIGRANEDKNARNAEFWGNAGAIFDTAETMANGKFSNSNRSAGWEAAGQTALESGGEIL